MPRKIVAKNIPRLDPELSRQGRKAYPHAGRPTNFDRVKRYEAELARDNAPSLICLGGNAESLEIIKQVKSLGWRPIVISQGHDLPAEQWVKSFPKQRFGSGHQDDALFWRGDVYNYKTLLSCLAKCRADVRARQKDDSGYFDWMRIQGVMCCAVDAPEACAVAAEKYRWPTIGVEVARLGGNKFWQYERLKNANILVPPTKVVNAETHPIDVTEYDILKPVDSRGARGVVSFTMPDFTERAIEATSNSMLSSIVAQQWIDGTQLSTESVIYDGEVLMTAIAKRNYARLDEYAPYVIEDGSDSPASLTDAQTKLVDEVIAKSCKALGWDNLTVKGDLVLDEYNQVWVIELAPRLSGGYFSSHIIPLCYKWNIIRDAVLIASGQEPKLEAYYEPSAEVVQRFIFPRPEWIGKKIVALPRVELDDMRRLVTWNYRVGDVVRPVKSHPDRLGQVLLTPPADKSGLEVKWVENIVDDIARKVEVE